MIIQVYETILSLESKDNCEAVKLYLDFLMFKSFELDKGKELNIEQFLKKNKNVTAQALVTFGQYSQVYLHNRKIQQKACFLLLVAKWWYVLLCDIQWRLKRNESKMLN